MTHKETLYAETTLDARGWRDEQDRADWFESQAEYYAALADRLEARLLFVKAEFGEE